MLRNLLVTTGDKVPNTGSENRRNSSTMSREKQTEDTTVDQLYINSRSGLRGLIIFLGVSIFAFYFREQSLAGVLPAQIMEQLGSVPSVILVNCVFGASTVSSLISIAGRIYHDKEPGNTSTHLLFKLSFYLLYFISGALNDYFNVVFISGLVVLGLQHYNAWNYNLKAIDANTAGCNNLGR